MSTARTNFRELCAARGIAVTQQRQVLYDVMRGMSGHPSPEEVYTQVRRKIPAISLATVYKNIHLFVESGVLRSVSPHHGSQRVEMNEREHHHMVCSRCKSIQDFEAPQQAPQQASPLRGLLPGSSQSNGFLLNGFLVERCSIDLIGLCAACQAADGV